MTHTSFNACLLEGLSCVKLHNKRQIDWEINVFPSCLHLTVQKCNWGGLTATVTFVLSAGWSDGRSDMAWYDKEISNTKTNSMKDKAGSCLHLTVQLCNLDGWWSWCNWRRSRCRRPPRLTSGTTGAGAKGELPALSSGPEALWALGQRLSQVKFWLRALSDFEAVRWEANLIS